MQSFIETGVFSGRRYVETKTNCTISLKQFVQSAAEITGNFVRSVAIILRKVNLRVCLLLASQTF